MNKILALALLFSLTTACTKSNQNNYEEKPDISFNAGVGIFTGSGEFGIVGPKDSKILTVKITNTGDAPLVGPAQIDNNKFSIIYQSGCSSIAPGKVCTLKLSFSASGKSLGVHNANFNLDTAYLALSAEIVDPNANQTPSVSFSANPLDFGTIKDNESLIKNLIITNTGVVNIENQVVTVGPLYNKIYDTCSNKRVLPNKTCLVKLQLVGTGKSGAINETLNFAGQPMSVVGVVVNSQGSSPLANPDVKFLIDNVESSNYDYGSLSGKQSKQVIIYAKNFGNNTSDNSIANLLSGSSFQVVFNQCTKALAPGANCQIRVIFSANGKSNGIYEDTLVFANKSFVLKAEVGGITLGNGLDSFLLGLTYGSNVYFYNPNNSGLYLWGNNSSYGNVGNNSGVDELSPVNIANTGSLTGKIIKEFSMYDTHACVLTTDNNIYCWGYNYGGQIGDGTTITATVPTLVNMSSFGGRIIRTISTGEYFSCAITTDDKIYCWGANGAGQSGSVDPLVSQEVLVPTPVDQSGVLSGKGIKQIKTAYSHACVIASDDRVYCWGSNSSGLLGNGTNMDSYVPVAVDWNGVLVGKTAKTIKMTYANVCIIASDDKPYCWGDNYNGNLGLGYLGGPTSSYLPEAVDMSGALLAKTVKSLELSDTNVCVIASDDKPYCWGLNSSGSVGSSSSSYAIYGPEAVDMSGALLGKTVKSLHMAKLSGTTICAIASDDKLYCWGNNNDGQLAEGTTNSSNVPVATSSFGLLNSLTVKNATVEGNNICVQSSNDQVYCIGPNYYGQLGDGTNNNSSSFVLVNF